MPEPWYLFIGLLVSSVGFVMLMYGRKQHRPLQIAGGLTLLILPFLVRDALWLSLASVALATGVWLGVRAGL